MDYLARPPACWPRRFPHRHTLRDHGAARGRGDGAWRRRPGGSARDAFGSVKTVRSRFPSSRASRSLSRYPVRASAPRRDHGRAGAVLPETSRRLQEHVVALKLEPSRDADGGRRRRSRVPALRDASTPVWKRLRRSAVDDLEVRTGGRARGDSLVASGSRHTITNVRIAHVGEFHSVPRWYAIMGTPSHFARSTARTSRPLLWWMTSILAPRASRWSRHTYGRMTAGISSPATAPVAMR